MDKTGRNDPCPCGSGKKYKKCCLPKHEAAERERLAEEQARRDERAAAHRSSIHEVRAAIAAKLAGAEQADDDELTTASNAVTRHPHRNRLIVLLSVKAGMRAGEIANLTWDMVLDAAGRIGGVIELRDTAAKKGSGRIIPMHPHLRAALVAWRHGSREQSRFAARRRRGT